LSIPRLKQSLRIELDRFNTGGHFSQLHIAIQKLTAIFLLLKYKQPVERSQMDLIQSFIAIPEAAAKQQALQSNANCIMGGVNQQSQSQESVAVQVLLFKKPSSEVQPAAQHEAAYARAV
jgi:hypothetical protein